MMQKFNRDKFVELSNKRRKFHVDTAKEGAGFECLVNLAVAVAIKEVANIVLSSTEEGTVIDQKD